MAAMYCCIASLSCFGLFFIPESPHWLVTFREDIISASKAMKWLYESENVSSNF